MSTLEAHYEPESIALFSEDGVHWKGTDGTATPISYEKDERVTRLVIGSVERNASIEFKWPASPDQSMALLYPNLSHLHLWGLHKFLEVPRLPKCLKCLDVRNCSDLHQIPNLPEQLDTLILSGLPLLERSPKYSTLNELSELDLTDCVKLDTNWINQLLAHCRQLRLVSLDGCSQLVSVETWPPELDTLKLNRCSSLQGVPEPVSYTHLTLPTILRV